MKNKTVCGAHNASRVLRVHVVYVDSGRRSADAERACAVWWPVSGEVSRVVCAIVWSRGARGVSRASLSSLSLDQ